MISCYNSGPTLPFDAIFAVFHVEPFNTQIFESFKNINLKNLGIKNIVRAPLLIVNFQA